MTGVASEVGRVLVCGSRTWSDNQRLTSTLDSLHGITAIIEGDARGADQAAGSWAEINGVPVETFPADWKTHGKRAGYLRNTQMLEEGKPDLVVAFVDKPLDESKGTAMMVKIAQAAGVPTRIVQADTRPPATVYLVIPEPCADCVTGLAWMRCADRRYRCHNCVHEFARDNGLDTPLPERVSEPEMPVIVPEVVVPSTAPPAPDEQQRLI